MDAKKLIELRKEAEKVVADMPEGDIKVKAFEVILVHLMSVAEGPKPQRVLSSEDSVQTEDSEEANASSVAGRLMVLREEGFFKSPKALAEIREELKAHAWHYTNATIAHSLIKLVQKKKLRRQRVTQGNAKAWKYTNP